MSDASFNPLGTVEELVKKYGDDVIKVLTDVDNELKKFDAGSAVTAVLNDVLAVLNKIEALLNK